MAKENKKKLKYWKKGIILLIMIIGLLFFIPFLFGIVDRWNPQGLTEILFLILIAIVLPFIIFVAVIKLFNLTIRNKFILRGGIIGIVVGLLFSFFMYNEAFLLIVKPVYYLLTLYTGCRQECWGFIFIYPSIFMFLFGLIGIIIGFIISKNRRNQP